ncbi:uncharacterized protein LOC119081338 [Bradysia coprophila]|uniref:uncharacterized protein LOC119081338 n=1 Tax=Bradysia coprophila TaxID=38358 RepID=UPI00187D93ED|nr:uncharacterized protein LOC119081338 [Bradysia coprophila]
MKASKKKDGQSNKKDVNGNGSTPTIDTYFKAVARQLDVNVDEEKNITDETAVRNIYIDALKMKLQGLAGHDAQEIIEADRCDAESGTEGQIAVTAVKSTAKETPADLHKSGKNPQCTGCKAWQQEYDNLQKLCLRLTIRNADMDLKFEDLLKVKSGKNQMLPDSSDTAATDDIFSARELKFLECMPLDKTSDSTFVHHCIQYAYKDNPLILVQRSLKGTAEVIHIAENGEIGEIIPGKDPMTPGKVEQIRNLFIQRVSKCQLDAVSYSERIKDAYLNRLIASGVRNIAKKKGSS